LSAAQGKMDGLWLKGLTVNFDTNGPVTPDTIFHHKSNGIGNGHSEPRLIADIEALWQTQPNSLLKFFIPRPNFKQKK
jgi:hypothetical protein